jgi:NAD(P) transhydrogenase subunit beta
MTLAVIVAGLSWVLSTPSDGVNGFAMLGAAITVGAAVGAVKARRVEMTGMPELVAVLHSFVGLAAVFVGISSFLSPHGSYEAADAAAAADPAILELVHRAEIWAGVAVGALTFTGSVIAWAKLKGSV